MSVGRRAFLRASGLVVAGLAAPGLLGACARGQTGELLTSGVPLPAAFTVPLPIPPVARPTRVTADTDFHTVTTRAVDAEILPGVRTPILGYDGRFPGPTIVSTTGRRTVVEHVNQLDVPIVVHLHGGHVPAASDGFPTDLVRPGETRAYDYPITQRAATLWYHDHRMDFTGPAVYRGLAGFHLVRDPAEDALGLPSGDRDVPLLICDRSFDADGALRYPALDPAMTRDHGVEAAYMEGVLGDVVLVNGAPWPELAVDAARYRFRLLNGSNARRYDLALQPSPVAQPLVQIASDGGLLPEPVAHSSVTIAPGERFDVVVDFAAFPVGSTVVLTNRLGTGRTADVLRFRVARAVPSDDSRVPPVLAPAPRWRREDAVARREFVFRRGGVGHHAGWLINGRAYDPARVDVESRLGDLELWRFLTDVHHPVHVHLDQFQVVGRGGGGPGPFDLGWKDTVDVRPGEVVEVLVRFTDHAGTFVMHCHNLEHEDMAMMLNVGTRAWERPR